MIVSDYIFKLDKKYLSILFIAETVQLTKVPEGHWLEHGESDIRNNLIGGSPAARIVFIDGYVRQLRSEPKEDKDALVEKLPMKEQRELRP